MTPPRPTHLGLVLYLWRTVHRRPVRALATAIGVCPATLLRLERGHACDADTWLKLQAWLLTRPPDPPADPGDPV